MPFIRHLEAAGTFNLRDVGNYVTADGRSTQPGRLFRCGAVHNLPALECLGIRTVLDLRTDDEISRDTIACGRIRNAEGVRRISVSLIPEEINGRQMTAYLDSLVGRGISAARYSKYLEVAHENIRAVIEVLVSPNTFPALVHCTAGKDRTGVIIALLLDMVGVPATTIVEDYDLTNLAADKLIDHIETVNKIRFKRSESNLAAIGAPRGAMEGMLAQLHEEHGSARSYLRGLGVDDSVLAERSRTHSSHRSRSEVRSCASGVLDAGSFVPKLASARSGAATGTE